MKLLEENKGETLQDIRIGKDLGDITQSTENKSKNRQMELHHY